MPREHRFGALRVPELHGSIREGPASRVAQIPGPQVRQQALNFRDNRGAQHKISSPILGVPVLQLPLRAAAMHGRQAGAQHQDDQLGAQGVLQGAQVLQHERPQGHAHARPQGARRAGAQTRGLHIRLGGGLR